MSSARPSGYSALQISLHWAVVLLVIFQFLASDGMEAVWRAMRRGTEITSAETLFANLHAAAGILILLLVLWRLYLRFTRGAPPAPVGEAAVLRIVAALTHWALYILLVLTPLSGAAAYFGGVVQAGEAHQFGKTLILIVAILHVVGVLAQQFVFRTDVLRRMMVPQKT